MNYIIVEAQTTNGTTAVISTVKSTYETAEQDYHSKLSFAAVSDVPLHSVTMLTERGSIVKYEVYDHSAAAEE